MSGSRKIVSRVHRLVRRALDDSGLARDSVLVVAVSGGPDSMALLHALIHLRGDLGLRLHGAHLDHGLRGAASEADARFVADTFRRLDIPLALEQADVRSFGRTRRVSEEQAAREVRYAFMGRVAAKQGAAAIALGHTADDQAETVLMHILRGSGLPGLRGMEPASRRVLDGQDVTLLRPLLAVSREETVGFCLAKGLEPRVDESNLSPELRRNWVRIRVLPLLREFNPAVKQALVRLSRSAAEHLAYVEDEVTSVWREVVRNNGASLALERAAISRLAPAVQGHLLRRALIEAKGSPEEIEQSHIDAMVRLLAGPAGKSLDLPGGVRFSVGYTQANLTGTPESEGRPLPLEGRYDLAIPGETSLPGWRVTVRLTSQDGPAAPPSEHVRGGASQLSASHEAVFDRKALGEQLWVRSRILGDRFQPLGMRGTKKLQDFMVDAKIPREWRDWVPLVDSPRGVAWVVGWRIADWARLRDERAQRLCLRFAPTSRGQGEGSR